MLLTYPFLNDVSSQLCFLLGFFTQGELWISWLEGAANIPLSEWCFLTTSFFFFAAWFAPVFSFLTAWKEHAIIAVNCMSTTPTDIYAFDGYLVSTVSSYQCTMLPKQVEQVFKQWEAPLFMSRLHCMHMTVLPSQLFLVIVIFFSAEWFDPSGQLAPQTFLVLYIWCLQPFDGYIDAYFLAVVLWLFFNCSSVFVHYS